MTITASRITPNTLEADDAWILEELDRRYEFAFGNSRGGVHDEPLQHAYQEYYAARNAYNHKWSDDD